MDINLMIDDLRNTLVDDINKSNLPVGVVELICKELYTKVQNQYIATINSERIKDMKSSEEMVNEINDVVNENQKEVREVLKQNEQ